MSSPGERVAMAMKKKGFSQRALAEVLGISQASVSDITLNKWPARDRMRDIARALGVDHEWLTVGANPPDWVCQLPSAPPRLRESSTVYRTGPGLSVVGIAAAGDHDQADAWQRMEEPSPFPIPDSWDVIQVTGDSAYPVAFNGQFMLIDTDRATSGWAITAAHIDDLHNDIVLVQTKEHGEEHAYVKRFCRDSRAPSGFIFASINAGMASPYLPPDIIDAIVPVVGVIFEDPRMPREKGRCKPQHKGSI